MNPAMIMAVLQLLQSGQFSGLTGSIPGFDKLTSLLGPASSAQPQANVLGAIQLLAQHMPKDPAKAKEFTTAIAQAAEALAVLQELAV